MKFSSIVKNLKKDGYKVEPMEFSFQTCLGVNGTALIDLVDGKVIETTARYKDVIKQIENNKSHIYTLNTISGVTQKYLTMYLKL